MWSSFCRREVPLGKCGPVITFSFDDFPQSAWTVGGPILESVGAHATYYTSMSLMDKSNNLGVQFTQDDLHELVERRHELASHTFSHSSARMTSFDAFQRDVEDGEAALGATAREYSSARNFAYPYGDVTLTCKERLGRRMSSCRGTCKGLNGPLVDLNLLRANSLYGDIDQVEHAKRLILQNEESHSWLIFYSHDVSERPSRYGCTPKLLEEVSSFAAMRGARFATVAEVVSQLGVRPYMPLELAVSK